MNIGGKKINNTNNINLGMGDETISKNLIMYFHNQKFLKSLFLCSGVEEVRMLLNDFGLKFSANDTQQIINLILPFVFDIDSITENDLEVISSKFVDVNGELIVDVLREYHSIIKPYHRANEFSHQEIPIPDYSSYSRSKIPVYILEEHKDGFLIWHNAIERGYMPDKGNFLLHIDHHYDMADGYYYDDVNNLKSNMMNINNFTLNSLGIANFITPAIYKQIFRDVFIFNSIFPKKVLSCAMEVHLIDNHYIKHGKYIPLLHSKNFNNDKYSFFNMFIGSFGTLNIRPCVLDIDLDYFYWDNSRTFWDKKLTEISEKDYLEFMKNPYNPMRITGGNFIHCYVKDDKYYMEFLPEFYPTPLEDIKEAMKLAEKRIIKLVQWLKENNIKPLIINICRSCISGFCPQSIANFIEEKLLKELRELYPNIEIENWKYNVL